MRVCNSRRFKQSGECLTKYKEHYFLVLGSVFGSPQNDFYLQRKNVDTSETYQVARSAFLKRLNSTGVYSVPTL